MSWKLLSLVSKSQIALLLPGLLVRIARFPQSIQFIIKSGLGFLEAKEEDDDEDLKKLAAWAL